MRKQILNSANQSQQNQWIENLFWTKNGQNENQLTSREVNNKITNFINTFRDAVSYIGVFVQC